MKVKELVLKLFELYPKELAADFDNVGLLVGNPDDEIKGVTVALDCTIGAIDFAKKIGANVIVCHHPIMFSGIKTAVKGDITFELISSGISLIAMHTNFDSAKGGVCDILADKLSIINTTPLETEEGVTIRKGELSSPLSPKDFAILIKEKLGGNVKYADSGRNIKTVTLCSGSGSSFVYDALISGTDAYVSGEIKHHLFYEGLQNNVSIFDCGHFESEVIAVDELKNAVMSYFEGRVEKYCHNEIKTI